MNFLAHLYLSGSDPLIMVGNFLGDFVKGKNALASYDRQIVAGIELHRGIDYFTDHNPIVQQSKNRLRPKYHHYSGVIVDMFYDHFLAAGWSRYHNDALPEFANKAYENLNAQQIIMPEEARRLLPYLVSGNWLVGYSSVEGIHRALSGMARRTKHDSKMEQASNDLVNHYTDFQNEFAEFFPVLRDWSQRWLMNNAQAL